MSYLKKDIQRKLHFAKHPVTGKLLQVARPETIAKAIDALMASVPVEFADREEFDEWMESTNRCIRKLKELHGGS